MTEPGTNYGRNIFINCPFDEEYVPLLHAITFTICFAQFIPRSALEVQDSGVERLAKIVRIIRDCAYGIHDISRVEVGDDPQIPLPRFNMPFECGLFFGALHFGTGRQKQKQLLIFDSVPFRPHKTMSDIAGKDPAFHHGDPATAIGCVRTFLAPKPGVTGLPGEEQIRSAYASFQDALPHLLNQFGINGKEISSPTYWNDFVKIVDAYLSKRFGAGVPAAG
ncbi:hypothetical protein [Aquabacterium humicola]|uniref:hypothetical protein n=1 Tax=Aquabacterium humicola TaxID=3237377 RepID=UPI002542B394|nr:hypothetical protein [Rubrivivax pictus]